MKHDVINGQSRLEWAISVQRAVNQEALVYFSDLCESPIERMLVEEMLVDIVMGQATGLNILGREYIHGESRFLSHHGIIVYPQGKVGNYRCDFILDVLMPFLSDRQIYAVECDGHDFHERTKAQAEHDRKRDRVMLGKNIKVLRFTGSEIFRSPEIVWREIVNTVTEGMGPQWSHPTDHGLGTA